MTQDRWDAMTPTDKDAARSSANLTKQLVGLEGCRVEVVANDGETRRFKVGRSTGWVPCHIELHSSRSHGGGCAAHSYQSVRVINWG